MSYSAELYMHDLDRKAFDALNKFPKFLKLQQAYLENTDEKAAKIEFLSTGIRLSDKQYPEIYNLLPEICNKLGIDIPELFLVKSADKNDVNAFTGGISKPFVCLTSELVERFPLNIVSSVIAHECGHIACKHYLYHSLARNFVNGITESPLSKIPSIRKYLNKTLVSALLFWDRCSELSADRAAVLCDDNSENTVDMLLKIHGFDDRVNKKEFIKQAIDLNKFINDSNSNKLMEQILVQWNTHPLLATRAFECYNWANSDLYRKIKDGTYTVERINQENSQTVETEELKENMDNKTRTADQPEYYDSGDSLNEIENSLNEQLHRVNSEIERYTDHADSVQYAYSVACGIISGIMDSAIFADTKIIDNEIAFSNRQVNEFIHGYASYRGLGNERLKACISDLEQAFKVAQDNVWKGQGINVSAKNHHLADLAHHPTPLGLISSLIVQFLRFGQFVDRNGKWHFVPVKTTKEDLINIAVPAFITGFLNWLAAISENKYEAETGKEMPKAVHNLAHVIASTPMLLEIIKCTDNWFGHLVSDMGGSKSTAGGGMGIPGILLSLMYEISSLPGINNTDLPKILNGLYVNGKFDLRKELALGNHLKHQLIPVAFNEVCVRTGYMIIELAKQFKENRSINDINWSRVIPFANRSVDRCMAIAIMTFNVIDTGDAAFRAALESGGDFVIFSGRFVARYNFMGAGRAILAIAKEVSNENRETQLIHERMILMEEKSVVMLQKLQKFKEDLAEKLTDYLVEDIKAFEEGFEYINNGLVTGNSDLVIKGNIVIQKAIGKESQFSNQDEFNELMESEMTFQL